MSNEVIQDNKSSSISFNNKKIEEIASILSNGGDIHSLIDTNTVDNMKAFLLLYARSQVNRVMKLTTSLEVMEDKLLDEYSSNPKLYDANTIMRIISTLQNSLNSAINLIKLVTGDDTFLQIIYNDNKTITNTEISSVSNTVDVSSPESREKLRYVSSLLLKQINEMESK